MDAALLGLAATFVPILGAAVVGVLGHRAGRAVGPLSVAFAAAAGLCTTLLLFELRDAPVRASTWIPSLGISFDLRLDALSLSVAAVAGLLGTLIAVYSTAYMREAVDKGYSLSRYFAYLLLFVGAMVGLALSDGLLPFLIFWETVGVSSFLLISFYHREAKARRAGLMALALTQLGGIGLIVAVVALWSGPGITTFTGLLAAAPFAAGALPVAAFGVLAAAFAKSAQFPFHPWLPAAMEAPTPISALIHAATMVNAGVYLVARTLPAFSGVPGWLETVLWVGVVSALFGALGALAERDLKRVLAYSTISQLGIMFAALGAGAVFAGSFHLVSQALFKALLFLAAGAAIQAAGTRDLLKMGGLGRRMRLTSASFLVGALAMAGIPPLVGFWSKDLALEGVCGASPAAFLVLAVVALLTALYGLRAWVLAFAGTPRGTTYASEAPRAMAWSLLPLAGAAVAGGVLLEPLSSAFFSTMPAYAVLPLTLGGTAASLSTPASLTITAGVVVISLGLLFPAREHLASRSLSPTLLARAEAAGFGAGALYDGAAAGLQRLASAWGRLETRDLNLNTGALLAALVLVTLALAGVSR